MIFMGIKERFWGSGLLYRGGSRFWGRCLPIEALGCVTGRENKKNREIFRSVSAHRRILVFYGQKNQWKFKEKAGNLLPMREEGFLMGRKIKDVAEKILQNFCPKKAG